MKKLIIINGTMGIGKIDVSDIDPKQTTIKIIALIEKGEIK